MDEDKKKSLLDWLSDSILCVSDWIFDLISGWFNNK